MLGSAGAVAAAQVVNWAILVAPPADAFGMLGMEWEFLGHGFKFNFGQLAIRGLKFAADLSGRAKGALLNVE